MLLKHFIEKWRRDSGSHDGFLVVLEKLMTNKFTISRWLNRRHRPTGAHKALLLREGIEMDRKGYVKQDKD